jgi:hypothetical protein
VSWIRYQDKLLEPNAILRILKKFHEYAMAHRLTRFISKGYKKVKRGSHGRTLGGAMSCGRAQGGAGDGVTVRAQSGARG